MSRTERGAYHDLLMAQASTGNLTSDMVHRILGSDYDAVWPVIQCKFSEKNNVFFNQKMLSECQRVEEYSKSRSSNRRKKRKLQTKDMKNICISHEKHMGSGSGTSSGTGKRGDKSTREEEKKPVRKRFVPPTVEQVAEYCRERKNRVDAQGFVDFYSSKGWLVGKSPMKDWTAAVRTWEKNNYNQAPQQARSEPQIYY